tara:strand:+ start:1737 stop:5612 length:3876 start_codon:yes stop_codon:yes gene_type:complete
MNQTHEFQIIDIQSDDLKHKTSKGYESRFTITLYGKTNLDQNIVTHVVGYYPYFYLKIPDDWDRTKLVKFLSNELVKADKKNKKSIKDNLYLAKIKIQSYKEFYGLHLNEDNSIKENKFAKVVFKTYTHMKYMCSCITEYYHSYFREDCDWQADDRYKDWILQDKYHDCESNLYESNIHPTIRFIHDTKIKPAGWVTCIADQSEDDNKFNCDIEISLKLKIKNDEYINFYSSKIDSISEYLIASFDIECDSSHGDFPQAKKDFKKLVNDIYHSYEKIIKEYSTYYNTNDDKTNLLLTLINLGFYEKYQKFSRTNKYYDINHNFTENGTPTEDSINILISLIIEKWIQHFEKEKILTKDKDTFIKNITKEFNKSLKNDKNELLIVQGDPVIQIGVVFYKYGVVNSFDRQILVIGPKDNMDKNLICDRGYLRDLDINCINCKNEKELLVQFKNLMKDKDPDFITGYNIFGFDFKYLCERADVLFKCPKYCNRWGHCRSCPSKKFYNMGKLNLYDSDEKGSYKEHRNKICKFNRQQLNSSALGENDLSYISMDGRILFDIQKEVQKSYPLESYKLDNVAAHFMRGKIKKCEDNILFTDNIGNLKDGDFISFSISSNIGESIYENGKKFQILTIQNNELHMIDSFDFTFDSTTKIEWCLNKDDISPQDIFDKHKVTDDTGAFQRAEVAKYCIQDCELCINLLLLLDIIPNNIAMANVSYVPVSYIFLRGQGVKVSSVVSRKSNERGYRIPTLGKRPSMKEYVDMLKEGKSEEETNEISQILLQCKKCSQKEINDIIKDLSKTWTEKYIRLKMIEDSGWRKPKPWELDDWYEYVKDKPIESGYEGAIVLDPTPGIYLEDPISVLDYSSLYPSSIIEKNLSQETHIEDVELLKKLHPKYYHCIKYENYEYIEKGKSIIKKRSETKPYEECYFINTSFLGEEGIIPSVLNDLLIQRKATKKRMFNETDEFKKKLLDGLQLAYKVTANSVYGQLGAKTSSIFKKKIAACTTSIGRQRIEDARVGVIQWAKENNKGTPEIVYGDTDSVFVKFSRVKDGKTLEDKEALEYCIQCGQEAGKYVTDNFLEKPQDLEYEKTFYPFILISKKRYTGDKYEDDPIKYKRTSMGIVLKRRDNAPIVKYVFGNVIEKILIDRNFKLAVQWLKDTLQEIRDGKFHYSMFIISKSLRGYYKNPGSIAHKVLADRMGERDPGTKPKANDRIQYAYIKVDESPIVVGKYKNGKIKTKKRNILQGDRIEHIDYILKNDLPMDYEFYITNQIMNPVKQVLDLEMDSSETEKIFI